MKVSKTGFIELVRCRRYAALEELYSKQEHAIVAFSETFEGLLEAEEKEKSKQLILSMHTNEEGEEEDQIQVDDKQLAIMLPYFEEIEALTARAVKNRFDASDEQYIHSPQTYKQKYFVMEKDGYEFYCFLDGFLEEDDTYSVFESKGTTTNKFTEAKFKKESIFAYDSTGILKTMRDRGYITSPEYDAKERQYHDKYNDIGIYVYDLAYQRYVIEHSKEYDESKTYKYYLSVLNADYIFDGTYDANGRPVYPDEIVTLIDLTSITKDMMPMIERDIAFVINSLNTMQAQEVKLDKYCQRKKNRECKFYPICSKKLPENNSIFTYVYQHHGFKDETGSKRETFDLIEEGYLSVLDVPESWLTRDNNIIQRRVVESGEPYFDVGKIRAGINALSYPIYHLDFESFPCPLPRLKGEKPYSQSLFQFSIHVEHEPGVCDKDKDHFGFLAEDHEDRRLELVEAMLDVIKPDGGSVLVYNQSFEKTRIRELAELYPEHEDALMDISSRLFDLQHIVKTNTKLYMAMGYDEKEAKMYNYYSPSLNGSYSIKKILPEFSTLSYKTLDEIQQGTDAIVAYGSYPTLSKDKLKETLYNMTEYCKLDTWSMVEILKELRKI